MKAVEAELGSAFNIEHVLPLQDEAELQLFLETPWLQVHLALRNTFKALIIFPLSLQSAYSEYMRAKKKSPAWGGRLLRDLMSKTYLATHCIV